jgi:exonuclease SbcC
MHQSNFIWKDFDAKDSQSFEATKIQQHLLEKEIVALENDENELRKERESISLVLKNNNTSKGEFEAIKAAKRGAVDNELSQLKVLSFADYESISAASIQAEKIVLHNKNIKTATDYQAIKEQIALQNQEMATLTGSLITLQLQVTENEKTLAQTQKIIAELLQEHSFSSVEEVRTILLKNWNIAAEKEKVKVFTGNLLIVNNSVSEAEKLILGKTFENKILEEKTLQFSTFKLKFETQLGIVSALQDNLKRVQAQFVEKADLLAQFELLNTRAANLVTLANMFNASGFVNYVSSIYLQNLADVANVRFHRMTKNQLSLTINSSNEFEVIDYLNNGASRSVKTLSGGQGFQASLCLALALAESVQSLNKNDKNFFFIDEGFGTQDPESVAVVFETLQSLYKENRIVGIISHVAELQERIPRSINVVKQEEKGSVISESWN